MNTSALTRRLSKKSALQYITRVGSDDGGDKLTAKKINTVMKYLKTNGWTDDELTDLVVAQALWDDDYGRNEMSELTLAIESLNEGNDSVPVMGLAELRVLIGEVAVDSGAFDVGDSVLFGKYKNKRGKIVDVYLDDRDHTTIEIEPTPKGRKKNVTMGLYKVWKDSSENEEE